jgi:AbrB family looped-hinge helix DNA binding protein
MDGLRERVGFMSVKVSPKYQVVIPETVRKALDLKPGTQVEVIAKGNIAYIVPVTSIASLQAQMEGELDQVSLRDKKDRVK